MAPFGWAIKKHSMDIMAVANSSFLIWYGDVSGMFKVPQSNTYKRRVFGGRALPCCAVPEGAAAVRRAVRRRSVLFIPWSISLAEAGGKA
jgi:hypothetical protein